MGYDYDKLYRDQADALGAPTKVLLDAFADLLTPPARVLDIGCGQGRDALPLARLGHSVVGVDISPKGIADLTAAAEVEGLPVTGQVADITTFVPEGRFDALLLDRTLHMLDATHRHAVLARLVGHLRPGGVLLLADEASNTAGFREVLDVSGLTWATLVDSRGYLFARAG
ncbi:MAG TPA: hypothetical protein DIU07_01735 [Rhodobacteraceae bacterium]|nr:hypothetical protein [Paracoccaceae bacterium]